MAERRELSKEERSLLLYFEARMVDHGCRVDQRCMNVADHEIATRWNAEGFVFFGRIAVADARRNGALWCRLSEAAFTEAALLRRERAERVWRSKLFATTEEARRCE